MITSFRILITTAILSLVVTAAPVGICLHAYSPEAPAEKIECFEYEKVERAGADYRFFPRADKSVMVTAYRFRGTIPYKPGLTPTHPDFDKLLKLYEETARKTPSVRVFLNPKILVMRAQVAQMADQKEKVASLPTITLADGSQLRGCTMRKIEDGSVSIMHQGGISKVSLEELDATEKKALNATAEDWSLEDPSVTTKDSSGTFAKIVFKNRVLLKKAKFKEVSDGNLIFMADGKSVSVPVDQFPGELTVLGDEVVELLAPVKKEASPEPSVAISSSKTFENSLGMKFVPVPIKGGVTDGQTVLFCVWETRHKDFKAFVDASGYNATISKDGPLLAGALGLRSDGVTMKHHWSDHGQDSGPDHPVVYVDMEDAMAFCQWLTKKERDSGAINEDQTYRLPWDHEWSCAVGIGNKEISWESPEEKSGKVKVYPWGLDWPPPNGFGNYGENVAEDNYKGSSPVGIFNLNSYGLYDMSGNVSEYCLYTRFPVKSLPVLPLLRGGGFFTPDYSMKENLLSSYRIENRSIVGGRSSDCGFRCVLVSGDGKGEPLPGITDASKALIALGDDACKEGSYSKDLLAASKHYSKAEELGHPEAYKKNRKVMCWLAYESKDKRETEKWYRKAAERGSAHGQWKLAACLYKGYGIHENKFESVKWAQQAAKNGLLDAQMGVAESYRRGEGVEQDSKIAAEWYRKAAERGLPDAQYELGFFIGLGYTSPDPGSSALESRLKWHEKAAYQEVVEAQFSMGLAYEDGEGFPDDFVKAYMWLSLASARQKNTPLDAIAYNPKNVLNDLSKKMSDEQIRAAEKLVSEWKPNFPIAWRSREAEELRLNDAD